MRITVGLSLSIGGNDVMVNKELDRNKAITNMFCLVGRSQSPSPNCIHCIFLKNQGRPSKSKSSGG